MNFRRGAVDCHAHVCGLASQFPYAQDRIYTLPDDATLENYQSLLKMLRVDRVVLVQPSVYGTDNTAMLAALKSTPQQLRGVAVIPSDPQTNERSRAHGLTYGWCARTALHYC